MKKAVWLIFAILLLGLWGGAWFYVNTRYANKNYYVSVVENYLKTKFSNKYKVYTAFWNETEKLPEAEKIEENSVLWLGSAINSANDVQLETLKKFDLVLTTSKNIANAINNISAGSVKVEVLPLFSYPYQSKKINKANKFVAVIGYPPFAVDLLQQKNINYKHYAQDDIYKLYRDLPYFSAVIGYPAYFYKLSAIHPIYVMAAKLGVPLISFKNVEKFDVMTIFADYVNYYRSPEELVKIIDSYLYDNRGIWQYVEDNFSKEKVLNMLDGYMHSKVVYQNIVQIDVATYTGDYNSGDYWLGFDFAAGLQNMGYKTNVVFGDSIFKPRTMINIIMRGNLENIDKFLNGKVNILYLAWSNLKVRGIEQTMDIDDYITEVERAALKVDVLVVSSLKIWQKLKERGVKAYYIPEFTNPDKFYTDFDAKKQNEILFVGNFHFLREGPLTLIESGLPITIYGDYWPNNLAKGLYIDNRILRKYYSSAKIVLNDTKKNMRDFGFMTTRLYDATASGAFVISDYIPEIAETYGDAVPMWKTKKELINLCEYYLNHPEERKEKALRAQQITLTNFTTEKIVQQFDLLIKTILADVK